MRFVNAMLDASHFNFQPIVDKNQEISLCEMNSARAIDFPEHSSVTTKYNYHEVSVFP